MNRSVWIRWETLEERIQPAAYTMSIIGVGLLNDRSRQRLFAQEEQPRAGRLAADTAEATPCLGTLWQPFSPPLLPRTGGESLQTLHEVQPLALTAFASASDIQWPMLPLPNELPVVTFEHVASAVAQPIADTLVTIRRMDIFFRS